MSERDGNPLPVASPFAPPPWLESKAAAMRRRLRHSLLLPWHWIEFQMTGSTARSRWSKATELIVESPDHALLPKHPLAGRLRRRRLVLHNGLEVLPTAYLGYQFLARAEITGGVDEPQEERVFGDLLAQLPSGSVMLELGSFWAFYSLWFHSVVPEARNHLVEPVASHLTVGLTNFELNDFLERVELTRAWVGSRTGQRNGVPVTTVDDFCGSRRIDRLAILHADIEGAETTMLHGARGMLSRRRIDYLFISTHADELHRQCRNLLVFHGYSIVTDASADEAYQADGFLFAARPGLPPKPIRPVAKRTPGGPIAAAAPPRP